MSGMSDQINARQSMANKAHKDKAKAAYQRTLNALSDYRAMVEHLQGPIVAVIYPQSMGDGVAHGIVGIADEAGELISILKRHLWYGEDYNGEHIKEELGDLFHFMTYLMIEYDWTLEDIMRANTDKLAKRYPNGFTTKAALERKDKKGETK